MPSASNPFGSSESSGASGSPGGSDSLGSSGAAVDAPADLTMLIERAGQEQDPEAQAELMDVVYARLRAMAGRQQRMSRSETLQATALVHEAYLRMFGRGPQRFDDRDHFFAAAATVMRQIAVDRARRLGAKKRGGGTVRTERGAEALTDAAELVAGETMPHRVAWLIDLDAAIDRLGADAPRQARVVELRFFAGLGVDQVAMILGVSPRTVELDWRAARARLMAELGDQDEDAGEVGGAVGGDAGKGGAAGGGSADATTRGTGAAGS